MIRKFMFTIVLLLLASVVFAEQPETVAGFPQAEAQRLGERMYREGLLPSGEPMQALVQLDVPVEGTMFTCQNCHLRSGLGSVEGTIITLPTNGAKLYRTFHVGAEIETTPARVKLSKPFQGGDIRPSYTDKTLAEAIENGFAPNGREFDWTMPRYMLDDQEMEILIHYLKNLSAEYSPGVNDKELRFATVVAEGVPQADRDAMLLTLQAIVKDRNSQSRHQEARAAKGPFYKQDKFKAYRRYVLDVWELKGPRDTWRDQLQTYNESAPVFALLGGIVTGDWTPVHDFCEAHQLPNIFPITDLPVVDEDDWYTLYFSKGYYQEGEAVARYIRSTMAGADVPIVQLSDDDPTSRLLANGFRQTSKLLNQPLSVDQMVDASDLKDSAFWQDLGKRYPDAVYVLWISPKGLPSVLQLTEQAPAVKAIFMSSGLLGDSLLSVTEESREKVRITYPYRLPAERGGIDNTVKSWLKIRKIPVTNIAIQSKMYFLGWMLTGVTRMMEDDFYRDYFLDVFDMMHDENYAIAAYPRVSFGPGQRYASKGCYIVKLGAGPQPELLPVSEWVTH